MSSEFRNVAQFLKLAVTKREPLRRTTNALRLVNGQGDDLPGITLDQYDRHFAIQVFQEKSKAVVAAVSDWVRTQFDIDFLIVKDRTRDTADGSSGKKFTVLINKNNSRTEVVENGLRFEVDLEDTLNPGLFLDMRANRKIISELCSGREVLNCFAYTCSFGVYARHKKASRVVNVDISPKALARGKANYQLNGLATTAEEFQRKNCLEYLGLAVKKQNHFDVVILDPPSFSRFNGQTFSVKKDLEAFVTQALRLLRDHGNIFVATNCSDINVQLLSLCLDRAAKTAKCRVNKRQWLRQDVDFPGSGAMRESHLTAVLGEKLS